MKNKMMCKKRQFAFRQWSRKPYAVFNSLKLLIKISVLSVAYSLVNPVQECKAQTDSIDVSKKLDLEEVEVSGQRAPVVYSQIARTITVISRTDVGRVPALSINELLENVPQVDIRQRGTNGVQADISIQGGSFDQTLILLNGINFSDPQTGHHSLNLPIDLESINRIEVLKGPASRVFGTNAFSGAVNFVTGDNPKNSIKISDMVGMYGLYRGSLSANFTKGNVHHFLSLSKSISDGYIKNADYDISNVYYTGKIDFKANNLNYQFGVSLKDFGANTFYSPRSAEQFESTKTYLGSIGFNLKGKINLTPNIFWRRNYDHYIYIRSNPAYYQNFHYSDVYGASLNSSIRSWLGRTSFGAEYRKEILYSTNLGNTLDSADFVKVPNEHGKYYTKKDWRENYSIFAEQNIMMGNVFVTAGIMANANTKLNGLEFYPGIDMGYNVFGGLKVYSSINRSLRLPTFTDLYYKGPQNLGNRDLKPEKAWTIEAGVKYIQPGIDANFTAFYRKATDLIDWIWQDSLKVWHTENLTELSTMGFEISGSLGEERLNPISPILKNIRVSYAFTDISKSSNGKKSNYALDNLRHKLSIELTHDIVKNVGLSWRASIQDRNGGYINWNTDSKNYDTVETPYDAFFLLDAKLFYQVEALKVFVDCNNLLDTKYIDFGTMPQPGFWLKAGIELGI